MSTPSHSDLSTIQTIRQPGTLGWKHLDTLGLLTINGPDAGTFLHNRTTSDVLSLSEGTGQPSALLERKAHLQSLFSIHYHQSTYWLLTEKARVPQTIEALIQYRIMEQFEVADLSNSWEIFACVGAGWLSLLSDFYDEPNELQMAPHAIRQGKMADTEIYWVQQPFRVFGIHAELGGCLLIPTEATEKVVQALQQKATQKRKNWVNLDDATWQILQTEAGIPQWGSELSTDTLLPETGLEAWTVSYDKGCFLGQETVARVRTYGSVPKALVGLTFPKETPLPPAQTELFHDNKPVGTLTTAVYSPTLGQPIAFAYLHRDYRTPGSVWTFQGKFESTEAVPEGLSFEATVISLPFYSHQRFSQEKAQRFHQEGMQLYLKDQPEEALALLKQALAYAPHFSDAIESLGVILGHLERYDEAIDTMHHLLQVDPTSVMAHTNMSVYYMKQGDKDRAEEEKAKATMKAFQNQMAQNKPSKTPAPPSQIPPTETLIGETAPVPNELEDQRRQDLESRIELFKNALQFSPDDPLTHYGLASVYLELHRYEEAIPAFRKVIEQQPTHSQAYLSLGTALEALHYVLEAKEIYQSGIAIAAKRGDLMPLQAMEDHLHHLATVQSV